MCRGMGSCSAGLDPSLGLLNNNIWSIQERVKSHWQAWYFFKSRPLGNPRSHRVQDPRHQHTQVGPERLNIVSASARNGPIWPPIWPQVGPRWPIMRPMMADHHCLTNSLPMDRPKLWHHGIIGGTGVQDRLWQ